MFVKKANLISGGYEANIIVTDGVYELLCYLYCFPPKKFIKHGMKVKSVMALLADSIVRSDYNECSIKKGESFYSYTLIGKIIDLKIALVEIGNIQIKLDSAIPFDIRENEFIMFNAMRLDCEL